MIVIVNNRVKDNITVNCKCVIFEYCYIFVAQIP